MLSSESFVFQLLETPWNGTSSSLPLFDHGELPKMRPTVTPVKMLKKFRSPCEQSDSSVVDLIFLPRKQAKVLASQPPKPEVLNFAQLSKVDTAFTFIDANSSIRETG